MFDKLFAINEEKFIKSVIKRINEHNDLSIKIIAQDLIDVVLKTEYEFLGCFSYEIKTTREKLENYLRAEVIKEYCYYKFSNTNKYIDRIKKDVFKEIKKSDNIEDILDFIDKCKVGIKNTIKSGEYNQFLFLEIDYISKIELSKYICFKIEKYSEKKKSVI